MRHTKLKVNELTVNEMKAGTNGAPLLVKMTTTARDALTGVAGMVIYNTTTNKINVYTGSAWEAVTSS